MSKKLIIICVLFVLIIAILVFAFEVTLERVNKEAYADGILSTLELDIALLDKIDTKQKNPLADRVYAGLILKNWMAFGRNDMGDNKERLSEFLTAKEVDELCQVNIFLQQYRPYALQEEYSNGDFRQMGRLNFVFTIENLEKDSYTNAMKMQPYYIKRMQHTLKEQGHLAQNVNCLT